MPRQTNTTNKIMRSGSAATRNTAAATGGTATGGTATKPTTSAAASKQLSVAQMLVLGTAAQRPDHMVLPLPSTLRLRAGGQTKLLTTVVKAELVEELPVSDDALCWRRDADEQRIGLRLTEAGLAAVQTPPSTLAASAPAPRLKQEPQATRPGKRQPSARASTATDATNAERPAPASMPDPAPAATLAQQAHPHGKLGQVLSAVAGGTGATLTELISLTGWQAHTARAALTGLRRRGFVVQLSEQQGRKAYRLDTAG